MWDTAVEIGSHLSHDAPCVRCGHAMHTFLPCSDACDCTPPVGPGWSEGRVLTVT